LDKLAQSNDSFQANRSRRERLVIIGNGMAGMRTVEEMLSRAPDRYEALRRHDLLHERFLVALPPKHRLATRDRVRLADLADEDWIAASPDGIIVRACRAAGFDPRLVSITRDQSPFAPSSPAGWPSPSPASSWPTPSNTPPCAPSTAPHPNAMSTPSLPPAPNIRSCRPCSPPSPRQRQNSKSLTATDGAPCDRGSDGAPTRPT